MNFFVINYFLFNEITYLLVNKYLKFSNYMIIIINVKFYI